MRRKASWLCLNDLTKSKSVWIVVPAGGIGEIKQAAAPELCHERDQARLSFLFAGFLDGPGQAAGNEPLSPPFTFAGRMMIAAQIKHAVKRFCDRKGLPPDHDWDTRLSAYAKASLNSCEGAMVVLMDGACGSACKDFVIRFQSGARGPLLGEATSGSTDQPDHSGGPKWKISRCASTNREYLPDSRTSEGVGVSPDIAVPLRVEDLPVDGDRPLECALTALQTSAGSK